MSLWIKSLHPRWRRWRIYLSVKWISCRCSTSVAAAARIEPPVILCPERPIAQYPIGLTDFFEFFRLPVIVVAVVAAAILRAEFAIDVAAARGMSIGMQRQRNSQIRLFDFLLGGSARDA